MARKMRSLNRFLGIRNVLLRCRWYYHTRVWGMDIHPTAAISLSAKLDKTFPRGVHIGERSLLAFGSVILAHDLTRGLYLHTRVGRNCFIGAHSIIMPGVEIGDGSIVGSGSVVTKSVPPQTIVAGNPARVLRSGIEVGAYGRFPNANEVGAALLAKENEA